MWYLKVSLIWKPNKTLRCPVRSRSVFLSPQFPRIPWNPNQALSSPPPSTSSLQPPMGVAAARCTSLSPGLSQQNMNEEALWCHLLVLVTSPWAQIYGYAGVKYGLKYMLTSTKILELLLCFKRVQVLGDHEEVPSKSFWVVTLCSF